MPHRDIELHVHPRDPRGRIRSLRLRLGRARALALLLLLVAGWIATGLLLAPSAIRNRLSGRDYRAAVGLRLELGDRLEALVDGLAALAGRGARLRDRLERIERIYAVASPRPSTGESGAPPTPPGALPETIYARLIGQGNRSEEELSRDLLRLAEALERIAEHERRSPEIAAGVPVRSPLSGEDVVLASGFGTRRSAFTGELEFHAGIDFAAPRGTPVRSPAAGVVAFAGTVAADTRSDWWRLGRVVVLRHGDRFRSLLGHLERIDVRPGERVRSGDVVGGVGDSGWATAPHLHFEIRRHDGETWIAVDPRTYLLSLPAPDPQALSPDTSRTDAALEPWPLPRAFLR